MAGRNREARRGTEWRLGADNSGQLTRAPVDLVLGPFVTCDIVTVHGRDPWTPDRSVRFRYSDRRWQ